MEKKKTETKGRFRVSQGGAEAPGAGGGVTGERPEAPLPAPGATAAEAFAQLVAQNALVLRRLGAIEQSCRTYVHGDGAPRPGGDGAAAGGAGAGADKARREPWPPPGPRGDGGGGGAGADKARREPLRKAFQLVDGLRAELEAARERRAEMESMVQVLKRDPASRSTPTLAPVCS